EASVANAFPPDGPIFLYWESSQTLLNAILRALDKPMGERAVGGDFGSLSIHNAHGALDDGTPWLSVAQGGGEHGPWGATREGEEYAPDTSGAGYNRGGAAVLKDTMFLRESHHFSMPLHLKKPSGTGVNGGEYGPTGGTWVIEPEAFDVSERR